MIIILLSLLLYYHYYYYYYCHCYCYCYYNIIIIIIILSLLLLLLLLLLYHYEHYYYYYYHYCCYCINQFLFISYRNLSSNSANWAVALSFFRACYECFFNFTLLLCPQEEATRKCDEDIIDNLCITFDLKVGEFYLFTCRNPF